MRGNIDISDYTYDLPDERIAKYPLQQRDGSKLLVYNRGEITRRIFYELPGILEPDDLLIYNDTRVIQARLKFEKKTGSKIEIFCLEPHDPADYARAFQQSSRAVWKCLVGNAKRWKNGTLEMEVALSGRQLKLYAEKAGRLKDAFLVRFCWEPEDIPFGEILDTAGSTPIPPYLNRDDEAGDKISYQTVYSHFEGSVAAPTAGLHFSDSVLSGIAAKGIRKTSLTLHVGAGTFRPVISRDIYEHTMHEEHFSVPRSSIEALQRHSGNILAVGTTSTRVLESLYWLGARLSAEKAGTSKGTSTGINTVINKQGGAGLFLDQWEAYDLPAVGKRSSLENLLEFMDASQTDTLEGLTRLMIVPGYSFRMVGKLLTNYHLPKSTLLLLVAAFIGEDWRRVYIFALENGFRFLSYGDSSLLIP
jgi:S-adenosylmethionine:tRNA ribosyltransferase-isomerase